MNSRPFLEYAPDHAGGCFLLYSLRSLNFLVLCLKSTAIMDVCLCEEEVHNNERTTKQSALAQNKRVLTFDVSVGAPTDMC